MDHEFEIKPDRNPPELMLDRASRIYLPVIGLTLPLEDMARDAPNTSIAGVIENTLKKIAKLKLEEGVENGTPRLE